MVPEYFLFTTNCLSVLDHIAGLTIKWLESLTWS